VGWAFIRLRPDDIWLSSLEGIFGESFAHTPEMPKRIVAKAQKLLFPTRFQLLKGYQDISFRYFGMSLLDLEEWLLFQDHVSPADASCSESTPSFTRRGFQFERRIFWHAKVKVGYSRRSD
jgi:hypothetical protein